MVQLTEPDLDDDIVLPKWGLRGEGVEANGSILGGGEDVISNSLRTIADISGMFRDEPLYIQWEFITVSVNPENFETQILTNRDDQILTAAGIYLQL